MSIQRISIIAATVLVLGAVGASAGDLPQYEVTGFPISPLQSSVLGSASVQKQSLTSALTIDGMPASLHQIAVISPRTEQQVANKLNTDASDTQHVDD